MNPIPVLGLDLGPEGIKCDVPERSEGRGPGAEQAKLSPGEIPSLVFVESGNGLGWERP